LLNTSRQIGGALGLAILVTVTSSVTSHAGGTRAHALVAGYRVAFLVIAGCMLLCALAALALPATAPAEKKAAEEPLDGKPVTTGP
jgi:hypothetical protein